ncbi:MAG: SRPBCC family protein, partial [Nocardioidaceae bacterium]
TSAVYDVLADVAAYPTWWPQVRSLESIDGESGWVACRSLLPYTLRFTMTATHRDRAGGVLGVRLDGDLDGLCRWTLHPEGGGTRLVFHQEVVTPRGLLRVATRFARPLLVLNHRWMIRSGRRGLARRLAQSAGR